MNAKQFEKLIQAATGRPLTLQVVNNVDIPLDAKISIYRPYGEGETVFSFDWKTPKTDDSLLRSFITAFCTKYREPDPRTYERNCPIYGDRWFKHEQAWNDAATHWNCALWGHHRDHMKDKETLKNEVIANFSNFNAGMARLGFYPTNYGIGIFIAFGGVWVEDAINKMKEHLNENGIPFKNELSEKGWVFRFLIGMDKESHMKILGGF